MGTLRIEMSPGTLGRRHVPVDFPGSLKVLLDRSETWGLASEVWRDCYDKTVPGGLGCPRQRGVKHPRQILGDIRALRHWPREGDVGRHERQPFLVSRRHGGGQGIKGCEVAL